MTTVARFQWVLYRTRDPNIGLSWAYLGLSWSILGLPWALLGLSCTYLGLSWTRLASLRPVLGPSWADLGLSGPCLGSLFGHLRTILSHTTVIFGPRPRKWRQLLVFFGFYEATSRPSCAILRPLWRLNPESDDSFTFLRVFTWSCWGLLKPQTLKMTTVARFQWFLYRTKTRNWPPEKFSILCRRVAAPPCDSFCTLNLHIRTLHLYQLLGNKSLIEPYKSLWESKKSLIRAL